MKNKKNKNINYAEIRNPNDKNHNVNPEILGMFDKEILMNKTLMLLHAFESMNTSQKVSEIDVCLALYPQISFIEMLSNVPTVGKTAEEFAQGVETWLKERYFIQWLLTCEAIDDLIKQKFLKKKKDGSLILSKNNF